MSPAHFFRAFTQFTFHDLDASTALTTIASFGSSAVALFIEVAGAHALKQFTLEDLDASTALSLIASFGSSAAALFIEIAGAHALKQFTFVALTEAGHRPDFTILAELSPDILSVTV